VAHIWQVVYTWNGETGGIGYTNLFFASTAGTGSEALAAVNKAHTLFQGIAAYIPGRITIAVQTDVRLIEDTTGDLVNIFTVSGVPSIPGGGANVPYAGASGACIDWLTGVLHGKHLMVGRTFIVPASASVYDFDGSIVAQAVIDLALAAEGMRTAAGPVFGVWGRPRKAKTVGGVTVPALAGLFSPAISSRVPDKAVVLRSRRD
jgi:hypothetical protein